MNAKQDGMAWLESLAEQYETTARDIRALVVRMRVLTPPASVAAVAGMDAHGDREHPVRISEAIRELLARKGAMSPAGIRDTLDWNRIKSRATDRDGLVTSSLKSMQVAGDVRRLGHGLYDLAHRRHEGGVS